MEIHEEHCNEPAVDWIDISGRCAVSRNPAELSKKQAFIWSLVLSSQGIECRLDTSATGYSISVPPEIIEQAVQEINYYELKNRNWPPPPPPPRPLAENTLATLSVLILLAGFHNVSRHNLVAPTINWIGLGTANTEKIMDGEWWRLITALTLHADVVHLLSNVAIGGVFAFLLCREIGSGLAWSLALAAGFSGNLANALFQPPVHRSVGASTAVFGIVGILAALSMVRYRHHLHRRWPLPVAAALCLLAILGTEGKNTDLGAHLFGFISGIGLGLATEYLIVRHGHPGHRLNMLLALLCGMVVCVSWWAAVEYGGQLSG